MPLARASERAIWLQVWNRGIPVRMEELPRLQWDLGEESPGEVGVSPPRRFVGTRRLLRSLQYSQQFNDEPDLHFPSWKLKSIKCFLVCISCSALLYAVREISNLLSSRDAAEAPTGKKRMCFLLVVVAVAVAVDAVVLNSKESQRSQSPEAFKSAHASWGIQKPVPWFYNQRRWCWSLSPRLDLSPRFSYPISYYRHRKRHLCEEQLRDVQAAKGALNKHKPKPTLSLWEQLQGPWDRSLGIRFASAIFHLNSSEAPNPA